jgi:beta-galactosidase
LFQYIKFIDKNVKKGKIEIKNIYDFTNLNEFDFSWRLLENGVEVENGNLEDFDLESYQSKTVTIDIPKLENGLSDYHLNIYAKSKEKQALIPEGHVVAYEQFQLQKGAFQPILANIGSALKIAKNDTTLSISNENLKAEFDLKTGVISSLNLGNGNIIVEGIKPNFWRATTDNDFGFKMPKRLGIWKSATNNQELVSLSESEKDNNVMVTVKYNLGKAKKSTATLNYTFHKNGEITVETILDNLNSKLPVLPRFGNNFIIKKEYDNVNWFGRGPFENYQDRNSSALVGLYEGKVSELYFPYIRPQENGYKTENRWATFTNSNGEGIKITAPNYFGFNAHHQYNSDFDAGEKKMQRHTTDIQKRDFVNINIDDAQMGVGGDNSWGRMPLPKYRIKAKNLSYKFTISKVK